MSETAKMLRMVTHEHSPRKGGAGMVAEQLAMAVARQGRNVSVWAQENAILPDEAVGESKYSLFAVPGVKGSRNPSCLFKMARVIVAEREGFSGATVHVVEPAAMEVFFYLQLLGIRPWRHLVLTLHGSEIRRWRSNPVTGQLFRRLAKVADCVHVLSGYNAREILSWIPELAPKLMIGFGVPNTGSVVLNRDYGRCSMAGRKVLLCVGRIHPRKGQLYLIECVEGLPESYKNRVQLRFVGQVVKDDYGVKVSQAAERCGCPVVFSGGVSSDELLRAYCEADLFAMTSVPVGDSVEGLGLVYLEASRNGLPVLANRTGGVGDAVLEGETGLLSEVGDQDGFRRNLMRLIDDEELCARLGDAGRRHVDLHTWDKVAARLYDFSGVESHPLPSACQKKRI